MSTFTISRAGRNTVTDWRPDYDGEFILEGAGE